MKNQVKTDWLRSLFVFHIGIYVIGALNDVFGELIDGFPRGNIFKVNTAETLVTLLFLAPLFHIIIGYFTYHCAYQRKGTAWLLTLMIILFPLASLFLLRFVQYGAYDWSYVGAPIGIMLYQMFFAYLSFYYVYNCYRLYRTNGGKCITEVLLLPQKKDSDDA